MCHGRALLSQVVTGVLGVCRVPAQRTPQSPVEVGASGLQLGQPSPLVLMESQGLVVLRGTASVWTLRGCRQDPHLLPRVMLRNATCTKQ